MLDKSEIHFPLSGVKSDERTYRIVANTSDFDQLAWVRLTIGRDGGVVGRIQEGDDAGMIVFFDEHEQERLNSGHYAVVMLKNRTARCAFADLGRFGLHEELQGGATQVQTISAEYPSYLSADLNAAKIQHLTKMAILLEFALSKRKSALTAAHTS